MKATFALLLLLTVLCRATPLNRIPHQHDLVARLSVPQAVPAQKAEPLNKPHDQTGHPLIHPEKFNKVAYLSTPLRGTETRDRHALGVIHPEERTAVATSNYQPKTHQQPQHFNSPELPRVNQNPKQTQTPSAVQTHSHNNIEANPSAPYPSTTHSYHISAQSTNNHPQPPSTPTSSQSPKPATEPVEKKTKRFTALVKGVMRKTVMYGKSVYQQMKSALTALIHKQKSLSPTSDQDQRTKDGYTEEDVLKLVNDIMTEIQMRTEDMRDHVQMLEKNDRWDPNDITKRERNAGVRDGPLLYMRTKVLVSPETVVEAVMTSTKKMVSSRHPQLPWSETSKLLREVQARLSEVLTPAK